MPSECRRASTQRPREGTDRPELDANGAGTLTDALGARLPSHGAVDSDLPSFLWLSVRGLSGPDVDRLNLRRKAAVLR